MTASDLDTSAERARPARSPVDGRFRNRLASFVDDRSLVVWRPSRWSPSWSCWSARAPRWSRALDWWTQPIPTNVASNALSNQAAQDAFGNTGAVTTEAVVYGMQPAIVGTLLVTVLASVMAIPLGIAAAVYLNEYGGSSRSAVVIRFFTDVMTGVPSVVMGIFIYTVWVLSFGAERPIGLRRWPGARLPDAAGGRAFDRGDAPARARLAAAGLSGARHPEVADHRFGRAAGGHARASPRARCSPSPVPRARPLRSCSPSASCRRRTGRCSARTPRCRPQIYSERHPARRRVDRLGRGADPHCHRHGSHARGAARVVEVLGQDRRVTAVVGAGSRA